LSWLRITKAPVSAGEGVDLHRSTLSDWVGRMTALLEPLADHIGKLVRAGPALFADDTPVKLQVRANTTKIKTARLWSYVPDERPWCGAAPAGPPAGRDAPGDPPVIRARMVDAARAKARRGELRISVPIGYVWHRDMGLGFDPDIRPQKVIRLVFERFRQLGSARQAHLSLTAEGVFFPRPSDGKRLTSFDWRQFGYRNVIGLLKNPF